MRNGVETQKKPAILAMRIGAGGELRNRSGIEAKKKAAPHRSRLVSSANSVLLA